MNLRFAFAVVVVAMVVVMGVVAASTKYAGFVCDLKNKGMSSPLKWF